MFKAQHSLLGLCVNISPLGKVFAVALFLIVFAQAATAQDLIINIEDITINPADSVFEIPVYLEDLTVALAAMDIVIQIDAPHIMNFDTLDFFGEEGEIIANWGATAAAISGNTIVEVVGGTIDPTYFIGPFQGQKLLFKLRGVFANNNPGLLCDSSGMIAVSEFISAFSDPYGNLVDFDSDPGAYNVTCSACGDANLDGLVNVSDAVYIINYIFTSSNAPADLREGDTNCDGNCNVSDAVWLINYVFMGGNSPCDSDGDDIADC